MCGPKNARRLRPFFQAHTVVVLTDQPLRQGLHKPETSWRLVKWSVELGVLLAQEDHDGKERPIYYLTCLEC